MDSPLPPPLDATLPLEPWVLAVGKEGVSLRCRSPPFPTWISVPRDLARALALRMEIVEWDDGSGVSSGGTRVLLPSVCGAQSWRKLKPVIDLSTLDKFVHPPKFLGDSASPSAFHQLQQSRSVAGLVIIIMYFYLYMTPGAPTQPSSTSKAIIIQC